MRKKRNAAVLLAQCGLAFSASILVVPRATRAATFTWIGTGGSWGDATQWKGSTTAVPPNGTTAESFLGNNGTITLSSGIFTTAALHVGQSGVGNPGTSQLVIDNGSLTVAQNVTVGEGAARTIIINGGVFTTASSKNFWLGGGTLGSSTAYLEIDSGTLQLNNKSGIVPWTTSPGASTINMSGGIIDFLANDNADTILAGKFIFSGGTITNLSSTTINELSGSGTLTLRNNSANAGVTVDQAIDTSFDGQITSVTGAGGAGKFTKNGVGNLTLGPDAIFNTKTQMSFNGGTVKLGHSESFASASIVFGGGTLDLNGFTQTCTLLNGNGKVILGTGGQLNVTPSTGSLGAFDGVISGAGNLSKSSPGTLVLTANQTYTGFTSVSNGTLMLQSAGTNNLAGSTSLSISSSGNLDVTGVAGGFSNASAGTMSNNGHVYGNVTVPVGSTIKGSGTFVQAVTVNGTIAANGSVGSTNFGSLSLNSASVNFELGAAGADKIIVASAGGLTLSGTSTVTLKDLGGVSAGTYTLIDYSGTPLADTGKLVLSSTTLSGFNLALLYNSLDPTSIDLAVTGGTVSGSTWNFSGDGNYSDGSKWDGGVPNATDAVANLNTHSGTITAATVTVTLDQNATLGTLNFDHATSSYTLAGSGANTLTMDVSTGQAAINVISGNHTISAPVTLNKDTTITVTPAGSTLAITGSISSPGRAITKAGAGAVQVENIRADTLNVTAGTVTVREKVGTPNSNPGTTVVSTLSITSGAAVDLTNNAMVVNYTTLGTLLSDTRQELFDGRLKTSLTSGGHALGYADNAQLGRLNFGGVSVPSNAMLVAYTFAGDANLDGRVNAVDFNSLAANFGNTGGKTWTQGDSNYDGLVNTTDFTALAQTFGQSLPAAPAPALGS